MKQEQDPVFEFSHRGVAMKAPHAVIAEALMEHVRGPRTLPVFCSIGEFGTDIAKLGDPWTEQGGIRAGAEIPSPDGRSYDLVVVTDAAGKPVLLDAAEWGEYGQEHEAARNFTDGAANHAALIAADHALSKAAAAVVTVDGQTDCTLASIGELNIIRAMTPDLITFGDDEDSDLWSNTESSGYGAWFQSFSSGDSGYWGKDSTCRAPVVRRVYR